MAFFTNDDKILFGSTMLSLDKRLIIGDKVNTSSLILLNVINKNLKFALAQYNNGNTDYYNKVKHLQDLIKELSYQCEEICIYRERFIAPNACVTVVE